MGPNPPSTKTITHFFNNLETLRILDSDGTRIALHPLPWRYFKESLIAAVS